MTISGHKKSLQSNINKSKILGLGLIWINGQSKVWWYYLLLELKNCDIHIQFHNWIFIDNFCLIIVENVFKYYKLWYKYNILLNF